MNSHDQESRRENLYDGPPFSVSASLTQWQTLKQICTSFRLTSLTPQLVACRQLNIEADQMDIVVVGRFKAGKSSLLNHIIGRELLPVGVIPVTSVITRVCSGIQEDATVRFQTGEQRRIPLTEAAEYIAESENPKNNKQVFTVDFEWRDIAATYAGIRFVDTPGTDSIWSHNTSTTLSWMPQIGAAILAINCQQPLSAQDFKLLMELRRYTPEIAVLITKADLVSSEDLEKVTAFIRQQISAALSLDLSIYPYSIRPECVELTKAFRTEFLDRLIHTRKKTQVQILQHKLKNLANDCAGYLQLALAAAEAKDSAKTRLLTLLAQEKANAAAVKSNLYALINHIKQRIHLELEKHLLSYIQALSSTLKKQLATSLPQRRDRLCPLLRWYVEWLSNTLRHELNLISQMGPTWIDVPLQEAKLGIAAITSAFQQRLTQHVAEALGINFQGTTFNIVVQPPQHPDLQVGRIFDVPTDIIGKLLPMWLFRALVNRRLYRQLGWEAEKHLYRLAQQWNQATERSLENMADTAVQFMRQELEEVSRLASITNQHTADLQLALKQINNLWEMWLCGNAA